MKRSPLFNYTRNRGSHRRSVRILKKKTTPNILKSPAAPMISSASIEDAYPLGEEIYIVGGGPSLKHFNFAALRNKYTIAVNKSIFDIPKPDYFISVDYTFLKKVDRQKFNRISTKKFFVANFNHPDLVEMDGQIIDKRLNWVYNLQEYSLVIKARRFSGIGYTFEDFNAGVNSGFCALQLAIVLGYKKIYLLGIDLNIQMDTHYHQGYGKGRKHFVTKLDEYYEHFLVGLKQLAQERPGIQVISCSAVSRLNDIIPFKDFVE